MACRLHQIHQLPFRFLRGYFRNTDAVLQLIINEEYSLWLLSNSYRLCLPTSLFAKSIFVSKTTSVLVDTNTYWFQPVTRSICWKVPARDERSKDGPSRHHGYWTGYFQRITLIFSILNHLVPTKCIIKYLMDQDTANESSVVLNSDKLSTIPTTSVNRPYLNSS